MSLIREMTGSCATTSKNAASRSKVAPLPGERGGEIETEAVDVHLADPVPQRVHDHAQARRVVGVDRVAGARGVHVTAGVVGHEPVVRRVVQPAEAQRRAQMAALRRVVEHHVEQHLQPGRMQRLDHRLELGDLPAAAAGPHRRGVAVMRGEEADGVVAPVVGQAARGQMPGGDELVDGQQLDRGHPEAGQVLHHRRARQPRIGSPQRWRHVTARLGEPLDVQLIDDGVAVRRAGPPVCAPRE